MARITYDSATVFGKMTAEIIDDAAKLKAKANRLMAAINEASGGGGAPVNLEVGGSFGSVFGVAAGSGAAFYTAYHDAIFAQVTSVSDASIASLDMGG